MREDHERAGEVLAEALAFVDTERAAGREPRLTQSEWAHAVGTVCARHDLTDTDAIERMIGRLPQALKRLQKRVRRRENLHRAELTVQERSDQIAEWADLIEQKNNLAQVAPKSEPGRPVGGERKAARDLGLDRREVERAKKIAGIAPEGAIKEAVAA
jgi:hypothetical protein